MNDFILSQTNHSITKRDWLTSPSCTMSLSKYWNFSFFSAANLNILDNIYISVQYIWKYWLSKKKKKKLNLPFQFYAFHFSVPPLSLSLSSYKNLPNFASILNNFIETRRDNVVDDDDPVLASTTTNQYFEFRLFFLAVFKTGFVFASVIEVSPRLVCLSVCFFVRFMYVRWACVCACIID